jgi:D-lactate dehydrogenase
MNICAFEMEDWERDKFKQLAPDHTLQFSAEPLQPENADAFDDVEALTTFIHSDLSSAVLEKLPRLKLVATRSTGFNHIDLDHCNSHDIAVANVPTYGQNTVAEHVFGLLLTISHRLRAAMDRTRRGDFSQEGLQGFDLAGKTLGVVGTGSIGRCVIGIAKGFDMRVVAFDVKEDHEFARKAGVEYLPLNELLGVSDVVTLHVPASDKTRDMISHQQFKRMKDGAVLINAARGTVVNVHALLEALTSGKLHAAGLDVLPEEPTIREEAELIRSFFRKQHNLEVLLADHILLRLRNVYITPHSAFNTREAVGRILDTTIENIRSFARGEPANIVSQSRTSTD